MNQRFVRFIKDNDLDVLITALGIMLVADAIGLGLIHLIFH